MRNGERECGRKSERILKMEYDESLSSFSKMGNLATKHLENRGEGSTTIESYKSIRAMFYSGVENKVP